MEGGAEAEQFAMKDHALATGAHSFGHILTFVLAITSVSFDELADATEVPKACYSAEDVRRSVNSALRTIQSIRIRYTAKSNIGNEMDDYVAREIVCMRPCLMYHQGAHGNPSQSWEDDLNLQRAWIQSGIYYNEFPWRRAYFYDDLDCAAPLPGTLQHDSWWQCSGLWPIDRQSPQVWGVAPMLHEVAGSASYDFVRPELEKVQGRWCHVLERRGRDALWIDCERPPGLMQRRAWDPNSGSLVGYVELADHRQVGDGVWVAFRYRNRLFRTESESPGIPSIDYTLLVIEASINDVDPAVFRFDPPKGSISFPAEFSRSGELSVSPGGLEHIDRVVDWIKRNHAVDQADGCNWASYVVLLVSAGLSGWVLMRTQSSRAFFRRG